MLLQVIGLLHSGKKEKKRYSKERRTEQSTVQSAEHPSVQPSVQSTVQCNDTYMYGIGIVALLVINVCVIFTYNKKQVSDEQPIKPNRCNML